MTVWGKLPHCFKVVRFIFPLALLSLVASCSSATQWNLSQCNSQLQLLGTETNPIKQTTLRRLAFSYCENALKLTPDGREAGLARDILRAIDGRAVFADQPVACSPEVEQSLGAALRSFGAGDYPAALKTYAAAATHCPDSAAIWVFYGHSYMMLRDTMRAQELLLHSLKVDPWNRSAHLFLSDLYRSVGDMGKAYDHAVFAVLSDPTYEHGWEAFREVANLLGLPWHRRVNNRGRVRLDEKNNPQIFLPPGTMDSPDASFWLGLGFIEAAELKKAVNNDREHDGLTPLERDRERVKKNLEFQTEWSTKNPPRRAPITDVFLSALETDFLDEAIFLHMIDARLASEFVKYREGSKARLLEYITRKVVPVISRPSN